MAGISGGTIDRVAAGRGALVALATTVVAAVTTTAAAATVVAATAAPAMTGHAAPLTPTEVVPGAGTATNYDSDGGGNCSFPTGRGDGLDVALSQVEYGTADACGGYLDVTGPGGSVRVEVTNRCPECQVGHVDLSRTAFARIAPLEAGQVDVSYSLVRNPPLAETIALRVKDGSSQWWMQIQAIDHGNPLAAVELQQGDGWRSLTPTQHNFWTAEDPGPGPGPFTVRLTDIHGQSATVGGISLSPDVVQRTDARLYAAGTPAPAASAPPTTAVPTTTVPVTTLPATTAATTTTAEPAQPPTTAAPTIGGDLAGASSTTGGPGPWVPAGLAGGATAAIAATTLLVRRRRKRRETTSDVTHATSPGLAPTWGFGDHP